MMQALRRRLDALWGRGEASITIPSMDGALRPNSILDRAPVLLSMPSPDNLVMGADAIYFSTGRDVFALAGAGMQADAKPRHVFEKIVSCLAAHASGALAVGTAGALSVHGGRYDGKTFAQLGTQPLVCPTALSFDGPDALLVCLGSRTSPPGEWKRDLMQRNRSGSVWRLNLADEFRRLSCRWSRLSLWRAGRRFRRGHGVRILVASIGARQGGRATAARPF